MTVLCQNSIISNVKGHCQGVRSREPKIRSPIWAALSRKTQSLFLSLVFCLPWLEHTGYGHTEKCSPVGSTTLVVLKALLILNKDLLERTLYLHLVRAPAKLSLTEVLPYF